MGSELVQQTTESSVFLTMSNYNDGKEPIDAELFLNKNYDIISADMANRGFICCERLRVSAQGAGEDSLYFCKTSLDEYIIVREGVTDQFVSDDFDEKTDATSQSFEFINDYSDPSGAGFYFIPKTQGGSNKGWLPHIRAKLLVEASNIVHKGFFRWMQSVDAQPNTLGTMKKPSDVLEPLAVLEGSAKEKLVIPLFQLVSLALDRRTEITNPAFNHAAAIDAQNPALINNPNFGLELPLDPHESSTIGARVRINREHNHTVYTIKSIMHEPHGRLMNESLLSDSRINDEVATFINGYPTQNLQLLEVVPNTVVPNTVAGEKDGEWTIRIDKDILYAAGNIKISEKTINADMIAGNLAMYGVTQNGNDLHCDHNFQFRLLPNFNGLQNKPGGNDTNWSFKGASIVGFHDGVGADYATLNGALNGADSYFFHGVKFGDVYLKHYVALADGLQPAGNFYYRENPAFYGQISMPGAVVGYYITNGAGNLLQKQDGTVYILDVTIGEFREPTPLPGINNMTHWEYAVTPMAVFDRGIGKHSITNGQSIRAAQSWYLDIPEKYRATVANNVDYTNVNYVDIVHQVQVKLKFNTVLSTLIKDTQLQPHQQNHYNELVPVLGRVHQAGKQTRYSIDKYCYSPNELFSYFNNEFFRFGCDEEAHFMLEIKLHDSKFELEVSKAFLAKYDLDHITNAYNTDGETKANSTYRTCGISQNNAYDQTKKYITVTSTTKYENPTFVDDGVTYDKLGKSVHSTKTDYALTFGPHQVPEETTYGTYIYTCGGTEEALRTNGRLFLENMNAFSEISIVSTGLGFSPQVGQDSASMKILASFTLPFTYNVSSAGSPLKCCDVSSPPIGDIIIIPSTSQYLRLTSVKSVRYLRFLIQKISREGVATFLKLPERGLCELKVRFLITK